LLSTIHIQCSRRHVVGSTSCNVNVIELCLLTAALVATKITQKHTPSIKYS